MILLSGYRAGNAWTDPRTGMLTPAAGKWLAELVTAIQTLQTQSVRASAAPGTSGDSTTGAAPGGQALVPLSAIPFVM